VTADVGVRRVGLQVRIVLRERDQAPHAGVDLLLDLNDARDLARRLALRAE
jgi:hypothetical protein